MHKAGRQSSPLGWPIIVVASAGYNVSLVSFDHAGCLEHHSADIHSLDFEGTRMEPLLMTSHAAFIVLRSDRLPHVSIIRCFSDNESDPCQG